MIGTGTISFGYAYRLLSLTRIEAIKEAAVSKVWIGSREHVEHLRRLAVVFAFTIRLKIVAELHQREMSPAQFQAEFGGGSVSAITKHFARLAKDGWLRPVRVLPPGGKRRGRGGTVYRATELAFCDRETWSVLPHSMRVAFGWSTFKSVAEQVRAPLEASALRRSAPRYLTAARLQFDQAGYEQVSKAVSDVFISAYEEQEDASRRAEHDGTELFRVGCLLLSFQVPTRSGHRVGPSLVERREPSTPVSVRASKAFADEVCMQIVDDANQGDVSVPTFLRRYGDRFDLAEQTIRRRFWKMINASWLTEVNQETGGRRKGAVEKFYRATGPALYDEDEYGPWANVPDALAKTKDWQTFTQVSAWGKEATAAGTLSQRDDVCLAWSTLLLDRRGWAKLLAALKELDRFVRRQAELAAVRLRRSGEEPIAMAVSLGMLETFDPSTSPDHDSAKTT